MSIALLTWALGVPLCLATSPRLGAQVVRGVVREAASGASLPGVLVTLDLEDGGTADDAQARGDRAAKSRFAGAALTNERGEFALTAGGAGRFRLTAKRIGVRRYVSPPMALTAGETKRTEVTLEPLSFDLPPVAVTATSPCSRKPDESERIAALWEETRAALTATEISLRDRLFRATVTRYVRTLKGQALRVLSEDRTVRNGVAEQPFVSFDAESLSASGYARDGSGYTEYFAPDATVLLSASFVRDHCFSLVSGRDKRADLVGLAFEPSAERELADIRGTMWLDRRTFELRLVEFRYANIGMPADDSRIGGEVHFARLRGGAWFVSRWFIRMPGFGRATVAVAPGTPGSRSRVQVLQYREEGGDVAADAETPAGDALRRLASLTGRVTDSTGQRPLRDATVRISGTRHRSAVRSDGSFRLDSLPAGSYTLVVDHPDYARFGTLAAEQDLTIEDEGMSQTLIRALGGVQLLRSLCGAEEMTEDEGALRVVVRDRATGELLTDAEVRISWTDFSVRGASGVSTTPQTVIARTDERGSATFCSAPARRTIRVEVPLAGRGVPARQEVTLEAGRAVAVEVRR